MPAFQENGQFIGQARYAAMLRMQRPPMTTEEFEDSLRRSLVVDKLRSALTELGDGAPTRTSRRSSSGATRR